MVEPDAICFATGDIAAIKTTFGDLETPIDNTRALRTAVTEYGVY